MTFLITAGPTQERIDPVRYLSNLSSGKMGYALAEAARKMWHKVVLISGPTSLPAPHGVKVLRVTTAREMLRMVMKNYLKADVIIMVAAVADYRPSLVSKKKIKKTKPRITLKLVRNPDILAELGRRKGPHQILVGFAAETSNLIKNAKRKLREKNCDWIIANPIGKRGVGFGSDINRVVMLSREGQMINLGHDQKRNLASKILRVILAGSLRSNITGLKKVILSKKDATFRSSYQIILEDQKAL